MIHATLLILLGILMLVLMEKNRVCFMQFMVVAIAFLILVNLLGDGFNYCKDLIYPQEKNVLKTSSRTRDQALDKICTYLNSDTNTAVQKSFAKENLSLSTLFAMQMALDGIIPKNTKEACRITSLKNAIAQRMASYKMHQTQEH